MVNVSVEFYNTLSLSVSCQYLFLHVHVKMILVCLHAKYHNTCMKLHCCFILSQRIHQLVSVWETLDESLGIHAYTRKVVVVYKICKPLSKHEEFVVRTLNTIYSVVLRFKTSLKYLVVFKMSPQLLAFPDLCCLLRCRIILTLAKHFSPVFRSQLLMLCGCTLIGKNIRASFSSTSAFILR